MKAIFRKVGKARFLGPAVIVVVALVLISNLAYAYTTSNLKVLSIQEDRFYNYDFLNEDEVAVFEDFEWGSDGTSLGVEPPLGDVDWTLIKMGWGGSPVAEIDFAQKHTGIRSARFDRAAWSYMQASYSVDSPYWRGFYLWKDADAALYTKTGDETHMIFVMVTMNQNKLYYYDHYGHGQYVCTISAEDWHFIEFRNINWGAATYDIYVDGVCKKTGAVMWEEEGSNGQTMYYNGGGFGSELWIDDIGAPSSNGVACAATMVFYNNAWVNKVKNMYYGMADFAVWDYALLNDGNGWIWDQDRGTKTHYPIDPLVYLPPPIDANVLMHLRVYAPNPPDYMENSAWGKYVIGTTHCDEFPENPFGGTWHGYHEVAEEFFADWAIDDGYTVFEDWTSFYNEEDYRVDVQPDGFICIWENDGYATAVYVP